MPNVSALAWNTPFSYHRQHIDKTQLSGQLAVRNDAILEESVSWGKKKISVREIDCKDDS